MIKLTEILKEIGEASIKPYKFKISKDTRPDDGTFVAYTFITDSRLEYELGILEYKLSSKKMRLIVAFKPITGTYDTLTNRNEQFRIMATVVAVIKTHITTVPNVTEISFTPSKADEGDERRVSLYKAYIKKQIPGAKIHIYSDGRYIVTLPKATKVSEILNEIGEGTAKPFSWRAVDKADQKIKLNAKTLYPFGSGNHETQFKVTYLAQGQVLYNISFLTVIKRTMRLKKPGAPETPWTALDKVLVKANISFGTVNDASDEMPETNLNEQYRLMATVMECIEDYVKRVEGLKVEVSGGNEYTCVIYKLYVVPKSDIEAGPQLDSRRGRLYKAFLQKNLSKLPFKMTIDTGSDNDYFELVRDTNSYKP